MTDRGMVIGNKIIYAKLKIQENKWMRNRLLSVQSTVDNKMPHSFKPGGPFTRKDGSRRVNLKKLQLKEDRRRLIAQDNAIMLKSISNIMRHNNIDTWASTRKYVPGMSNVGGRKKEMQYIKWENRILLKRLKQTTPLISNKDIKRDFDRQMKHLKHMGEYAYQGGGKKHGSFDKYWQIAVYEARPIRGKNSNITRPHTTKSSAKHRVFYRKKKRRSHTSQNRRVFSRGNSVQLQNINGVEKLVDRPGTSGSMRYRPGTSGSLGMVSNISENISHLQSQARNPAQIPISSWDTGQKQLPTASPSEKGKILKLAPIKALPLLPRPFDNQNKPDINNDLSSIMIQEEQTGNSEVSSIYRNVIKTSQDDKN